MRNLLSLAFCICGLGLSAATLPAGEDGPTVRSTTDGHQLTLRLYNLEQKTAEVEITPLTNGTDVLYAEQVKAHNGFAQQINLSELPNGRYLLTVKHEEQTYRQVVRVTPAGVIVSQWN